MVIKNQNDGARWARCDLHVHTPFDLEKRFEENVQHAIEKSKNGNQKDIKDMAFRFFDSCRNKELDLIAITDHNAVQGLEYVKEYLPIWQDDRQYNLEVLPGIELTVGGERNLHVLLIVGSRTPPKDLNDFIVSLFGAERTFSPSGQPQSCRRSLEDFLEHTRSWFERRPYPYLLIPAHINRPSGIDRELRDSGDPSVWSEELKGMLRKRAFGHNLWAGFQTRGDVNGIPKLRELLQEWAAAFYFDKQYDDLSRQTQSTIKDRVQQGIYSPLIEASDPSCLGDIGSAYTWMKMGIMDVEGIRLALLDPKSRLRNMEQGPPRVSFPIIRKLVIKGTDFYDEITIPFNPSLNTLIGGRGSGKSTVIECMRHVLGRDREEDFMATEKDVWNSIQKLWKPKTARDFGESPGIVLSDSEIEAEIEVSGRIYRITWNTARTAIRTETDEPSSTFDIRTLINPRIISQGQIGNIAKDPAAQLREIDAISSEDDMMRITQEIHSLRNTLQEQQTTRLRLREAIWLLPEKQTRLQKVNDSLSLLENEANKAILDKYRKLQTEKQWLDKGIKFISDSQDKMVAFARDIRQDMDSLLADKPQTPSVSWVGQVPGRLRIAVERVLQNIEILVSTFEDLNNEVMQERDVEWSPEFQVAQDAYAQLRTSLTAQGIDFSQHANLMSQGEELKQKIADLLQKEREVLEIETAIGKTRSQLIQTRNELYSVRQHVANRFEEMDADVRISLALFGDKEGFYDQRETWFQGTGLQERDWEILTAYVFGESSGIPDRLFCLSAGLREDLARTKEKQAALTHEESKVARLLGARSQELTRHFFNSLRRPERINIDAIERYLPEDKVLTRVRDSQGNFKPIDQGSMGLKNTAILSVLLSAGNQPLIIDQPEEDLDNEYVYKVIVDLLRRQKFSRQIIVATHNANIPVNGDAELIVSLGVDGQLGMVDTMGTIDDFSVKTKVSEVMEGSAEAFRLRWERYRF